MYGRSMLWPRAKASKKKKYGIELSTSSSGGKYYHYYYYDCLDRRPKKSLRAKASSSHYTYTYSMQRGLVKQRSIAAAALTTTGGKKTVVVVVCSGLGGGRTRSLLASMRERVGVVVEGPLLLY